MTKFEKLTADLKAAYNAAYPAAIKTDEGGTMNFDAPGVWLPRWPESKTLEAVKAAGWHAIKWDGRYLGRPGFWLLVPPSCGCGNRKSIFAEMLTEHLTASGYAAYCYTESD